MITLGAYYRVSMTANFPAIMWVCYAHSSLNTKLREVVKTSVMTAVNLRRLSTQSSWIGLAPNAIN
jgi:hypothetical protein